MLKKMWARAGQEVSLSSVAKKAVHAAVLLSTLCLPFVLGCAPQQVRVQAPSQPASYSEAQAYWAARAGDDGRPAPSVLGLSSDNLKYQMNRLGAGFSKAGRAIANTFPIHVYEVGDGVHDARGRNQEEFLLDHIHPPTVRIGGPSDDVGYDQGWIRVPNNHSDHRGWDYRYEKF